MPTRLPAVAGRFYPADERQCRIALSQMLPTPSLATQPLPAIGGLMPHAGWICSGAVAARVAAALCTGINPTIPPIFVIFGAVHFWPGHRAAVFPSGAWLTPLGPIEIDAALATRILAADDTLFESNPRAHDGEHSIEVEVPFLQHLAPSARILPIMVPPTARAADVGRTVARVCKDSKADARFIASSDLTHYGPSYGFTPRGIGAAGLAWAKDVNDRELIDMMCSLRADEIVAESCQSQNACGPGAIAATIAASAALGATRGRLLQHTNSYEVLRERLNEPPTNAVGYAAVVFDR